MPLRRATFESLVAAKPDVVVRLWGGDARLSRALEKKAVTTVTLDDAADFDGVRANVRKVAAALDRRAEGEAIILRMDAQLARSGGAGKGRPALYLTPGGYTAGSGTLIDAMLKSAGYANANTAPYFAPVSLERMVAGSRRRRWCWACSTPCAPGPIAGDRGVTRPCARQSRPGPSPRCRPRWSAVPAGSPLDGAEMLAKAAR
ncbi:ABC transporter substrate-binding protein [Caulobacter segnis]